MQAWRFQPGQYGHETVDGPRNTLTRQILRPPVPVPPALADPSVSWSRGPREPFRRRLNQTGHPTHNMVVDWTGQIPDVSQDSIFLQSPPATSNPIRDSCNNVDAVPAPGLSLYPTNLDLYQWRPGQSSASVSDASEMSDLSRTLHNTPELSSSSRNSSISAIPDAYLPARNPSYGTFHSFPGSHRNHVSSNSNSSNPYTPTTSRNQSASSHTLQETASDEACKITILNVRAGVTHEEISKLLDDEILYVQHEKPRRGQKNRWSVKFSRKDDAEMAKVRLDGLIFRERKLQVHLSNGGTHGQISSGASTTSTTSSTTTPGPTIVDGSVAG